MSIAAKLTAGNLPDNALAFTNRIYVPPGTFSSSPIRVQVRGFPFFAEAHQNVEAGTVGMNKIQRECARIGLKDEVILEPVAKDPLPIGHVKASAEFFQKPRARVELDGDELAKTFKSVFEGHGVAPGQTIAIKFTPTGSSDAMLIIVKIVSMHAIAPTKDGTGTSMATGLIKDVTEFELQAGESGLLQPLSKKTKAKTIFRPDFDFEDLGIGGLGKEFGDIFRRAFASRVYPPHIVRDLGINHVRGMVLWGPPGTGKTLIARKIAHFLDAAEPKIINGPEILSKFVGESEKNIRELFADAEKEYKAKGDDSQLHIVIFDEIDAICKSRGSAKDGTGVGDSVVNQLLAKIDGVDALNNILIIGMTNRKDMLDEALLRPGRLEVHVEISLPDEAGRVEILQIHTAKMRKSNHLADEVSLDDIAKRTKNFSGAEIEGMVRAATSWAFNRRVNIKTLTSSGKGELDLDDVKVELQDFDRSLKDIQPAFGAQSDDIGLLDHPILEFAPAVSDVCGTLRLLTQQVRESSTTSVISVLIDGAVGAGKSSLAGFCAKTSGFPFVRLVAADKFIGMTELGKVNAISKVFDDAYKSELSLVILDDIERLCEYAAVGPRFSNLVLQALMVLVKKEPPKRHRKLLVVATTGARGFTDMTELTQCFNLRVSAPLVAEASHFRQILLEQPGFQPDVVDRICHSLPPMGVKRLLLLAEMSRQACSPEPVRADAFLSCLRQAGHD
jgi:vesicle-fusing ATPase